jgi:ABC-type uncharacterized transport system, permease component
LVYSNPPPFLTQKPLQVPRDPPFIRNFGSLGYNLKGLYPAKDNTFPVFLCFRLILPMGLFKALRKFLVLVEVYYQYMLEYRSEIFFWMLSGILPFILMGIWIKLAELGVLEMEGGGFCKVLPRSIYHAGACKRLGDLGV